MPIDALEQIGGGQHDVECTPITTTIFISLYTLSIVASACDDCVSQDCPTKASESEGSCCLCSGYGTCNGWCLIQKTLSIDVLTHILFPFLFVVNYCE